MPALREIFASFGVDFDTRPLQRGTVQVDAAKDSMDQAERSSLNLSDAVRTLGTAIAGYLTVSGITQFVSSTIQSTNELTRWSQRLNMSTSDIVAWQRAAAPLGANLDDVTDALKELQLKAQDALTGGTAQAEMFQRIGIGLNDLRPIQNDANAIMELFVTRLNQVNDAGLRNFTVDELMSDAGTRMLPVFMQGTERLRELRRAAMQESSAISELSARMNEINAASARVNAAWEDMRARVVLWMIPAISWLTEKGTELIRWLQSTAENTHLLESALIAFGVVAVAQAASIIAAWAPVVAPFVLAAVAVAALALVFEDLWVTMEGGDSVTRRVIDGMLGVGTTAAIVRDLGDAWDFVVEHMRPVIDLLRQFFEWRNRIVEEGLGAIGRGMYSVGPGRAFQNMVQDRRRSRERELIREDTLRRVAERDRQRAVTAAIPASERGLETMLPEVYGLDQRVNLDTGMSTPGGVTVNQVNNTNIQTTGDERELERRQARLNREQNAQALRQARTATAS